MMPPPTRLSCTAVAGLLSLLALCSSLPGADGHAYMTTPLSRVRVIGQPDWVAAGGNGLGQQPFRKYPDGLNMNDQPDVCGDPHQDVGYTGAVTNPQPWSGRYRGQLYLDPPLTHFK